MFSPHERIFNTPDVSVPAADAFLQQLRLERILKRFGCFAYCMPLKTYDDNVAPLVTLGAPVPRRAIRPFGAQEAFTGWQRNKNIQIPRPKVSKPMAFPGYTVSDPYPQRDRQTIGGCKYGGVHLSKNYSSDIKRTDIFKPFRPFKSPLRLPALQRERNKDSQIQDADIQKHIRLDLTPERRNTESKEKRVRAVRKKKKKELEFMKWEASHEEYLTTSVSNLHDYVSSKETTHTHPGNEQKFREQIETQIKRGVQQRVESFGPSGKKLAQGKQQLDPIPILELEFKHKNGSANRVSRK